MNERKLSKIIFEIILIAAILFGAASRFYKVDWDSGALLHPDEYGLTNSLTWLSMPKSLFEYFNTRLSPLSPYNQYDLQGEMTINGPDNRMRWGQLPITMIRLTAELFNQTGYMEMRRTGRYLSAFMDVCSLVLLYFIARRLFRPPTIALLACALSSMAVMQIQQSHFMTVDNFAVFFSMLTIYASVCLAQSGGIQRGISGSFQLTDQAKKYFILFGIFLGMTMACKINLAVLGLVLAVAAFIMVADVRLYSQEDFQQLLTLIITWALITVLVTVLSFRVFQPMSFRASQGDTSILTLRFNPDWWESMQVAASESSGIGGGPPSEQWAHRTPIFFPLVNMVFYGMGIPLGLAVWISCLAATWLIFRNRCRDWKQILIPLFWALFFFAFMGTRFVKCIRYMLPVYPMMCLMASWGLYALWRKGTQRKWCRIASIVSGVFVLGGTFIWAWTFVLTIYGQDHSRVEATRWIYDNIPAPFNLKGTDTQNGEDVSVKIIAPDKQTLEKGNPFNAVFLVSQDMQADSIYIPFISSLSGESGESSLTVTLLAGENSQELLSVSTSEQFDENERALTLEFPEISLSVGVSYHLIVALDSGQSLLTRRAVIANENWDEGLPFRMDNVDPFGQYYTGITNEVRWYDSEDKKQMFLDRLQQADYLIMPSQRAVWSVCRIPMTYPMTIRYYHALLDGVLGFDLAAAFQRPFKIADLYISDLAGSVAIGKAPDLPVENLSVWSAEEAFSVYDHPPVWIFKKRADFDLSDVETVLDSVDLSSVVVQGPTDAVWP